MRLTEELLRGNSFDQLISGLAYRLRHDPHAAARVHVHDGLVCVVVPTAYGYARASGRIFDSSAAFDQVTALSELDQAVRDGTDLVGLTALEDDVPLPPARWDGSCQLSAARLALLTESLKVLVSETCEAAEAAHPVAADDIAASSVAEAHMSDVIDEIITQPLAFATDNHRQLVVIPSAAVFAASFFGLEGQPATLYHAQRWLCLRIGDAELLVEGDTPWLY